MEKEICAVCSSPDVKEIKKDRTTKFKNVPVMLSDVSMFKCGTCGEEYFTPAQVKEFSSRAKEEARKRLRLMTPNRIIEIRSKHHLTQAQFEYILGVGQKVVTRWECGKVLVPKPVNDLLRLMEETPELVDKLKRIREEEEYAH